MSTNEILTLKVDISQADKGIADISEDFVALKKMVGEVNAVFSKSFGSLQNTLAILTTSIDTMTISLENVAVSLSVLMGRLSTEGLTGILTTASQEVTSSGDLVGAAVEGIVGSVSGLVVTETIIPLFGKALTALGELLGTSAGGAGLLVAGILAVIAAIVALVLNWDTVSATLVQGFEDFKTNAGQIWGALDSEVIQPITGYWGENFDDLMINHLQPLQDKMSEASESIGENLNTLWNEVVQPAFAQTIEKLSPLLFETIFSFIGAVRIAAGFITGIIGAVITVFDGLLQFITGVFTGDWDAAWEGLRKTFEGVFEGIATHVKTALNGGIYEINKFITKIYPAIVGLVDLLNVPITEIGKLLGQNWGINLPSRPPQIPYLAKGAVLPANRPFLAMVGDQRHGTNIEAPLTTIQEAVAVVMEDYAASNMAGHEATVAVLKEILEAVLGVSIGDDVIGRAADRYRSKMAVVRGGW